MADARRPPLPDPPAKGPFAAAAWRSPLRGPWLASFLSSALLPLIVIAALTGFFSHAAYEPGLGRNAIFSTSTAPGFDPYFFGWPTSPSWLYAATQGLHVISGLAVIPILLAKLWAVMPKLFERPAVRSIAHGLERLALALLVGGSLFTVFTGVLNIQLYYPWKFSFVPAHYYGAVIFLAGLALHIALKLPIVRRAFQEQGVVRPLRSRLSETRPEPGLTGEHTTAPEEPAAPTISRRGLIGLVAAGSAGLAAMGAAQVIGGPFRGLALLAPRGRSSSGPNGFPVNKTFDYVGIQRSEVGSGWRLKLIDGDREVASLSRADLLALPQRSETLPIACVEGWSTTQRWTGVGLRDLARMAGVERPKELTAVSLQKAGAFRQATLSRGQVMDSRSLLALKVNGVDLSLDHGFPARVIVPALPGVHNTKWVSELSFVRA